MKANTRELDPEGLPRRLRDQLRKLRRRDIGDAHLKLADLRDLVVVAEALYPDKPDRRTQVEAALELAITDYSADPEVRNPQNKEEVARLWFGLHKDTRGLHHNERHKKAWEHEANRPAELTWRNHRAPKILKFLADRLKAHYLATIEAPDIAIKPDTPAPGSDTPDSPQEPLASGPEHVRARGLGPRIWQRWALGFAVSLVIGVVMFIVIRVLAPDDPRLQRAHPTFEEEKLEPANFPLVLKGNGTETMDARGHYGKRRFVARSGLVIAHTNNEVEIRLYPEPTSCAYWWRGTPAGIQFSIGVTANAETIQNVPVGGRLRQYSLEWVTYTGNSVQSNMLEDSTGDIEVNGVKSYSFGPGFVELTKIDTSPGGFWRGRVTTNHIRLPRPNHRKQYFAGTFAAEWCNIEPFQAKANPVRITVTPRSRGGGLIQSVDGRSK